ncbi:hypothetical protein GCM10023166_12020 [Paeniglutamicibacter cryotolerans]
MIHDDHIRIKDQALLDARRYGAGGTQTQQVGLAIQRARQQLGKRGMVVNDEYACLDASILCKTRHASAPPIAAPDGKYCMGDTYLTEADLAQWKQRDG